MDDQTNIIWFMLFLILMLAIRGFFRRKSKVDKRDTGHRYGITESVEKPPETITTSTNDFIRGGVVGAIIVLIFSSIMGGSSSSDELLCVVIPVGILIGGSGGVVTVVLCKKWGLEINNILASLVGGVLASLFFGGVALKVAIALVFV